jgi:replication-associated recombination protein RarA
MLAQTHRPKRFQDIEGQVLPVTIMRNTARDPEGSARVYLFHGFFGTGKTTLARVFATALNCEAGGEEPCGVCKVCTTSLDYASFYSEYDCGAVGNKEDIDRIKETLILDSSLARYRVVVFDEFHLASNSAQSDLLKVLEELSSNTFVILCTTNHFQKLTVGEVCSLLRRIASSVKFPIEEKSLMELAKATDGHARDAIKLLDMTRVVGLDMALESFRNAHKAALKVLSAIRTRNQPLFEQAVEDSVRCLRSQYTRAMYQEVCTLLKPEESALKTLWGADSFKLFKLLMQPWAVNAMKDDITVQSLLWVLWATLGDSDKKQAGQKTSQHNAGGFRVSRS